MRDCCRYQIPSPARTLPLFFQSVHMLGLARPGTSIQNSSVRLPALGPSVKQFLICRWGFGFPLNLADETLKSIMSNRSRAWLCPSPQKNFPAALSPASPFPAVHKFCVTPLCGSDHLPAIPSVSATFLAHLLFFLGFFSLPVISGEAKKPHDPGTPCGEGPAQHRACTSYRENLWRVFKPVIWKNRLRFFSAEIVLIYF